MAQATGHGSEIQGFYAQIDEMREVWDVQLSAAIQESEETVGGKELFAAIDAGAVEVADLSTSSASETVAEALRAATGDQTSSDVMDELLFSFFGRVLEIVEEPTSFPLLDADSSDLLRSFQNLLTRSDDYESNRGKEVTAASSLMGFLPYFADLGMDEILDLRSELRKPLVRFRAAMSRISHDFATRPIDAEFEVEVQDVWRTDVEPALLEIRESLAEHGLLREAASVVAGDPKRLLMEAGGALIVGHSPVTSVADWMVAAATVALPAADVFGRAFTARREVREAARKNPFFFLHRLAEEAERRT